MSEKRERQRDRETEREREREVLSMCFKLSKRFILFWFRPKPQILKPKP